jgi:hypothetical protein
LHECLDRDHTLVLQVEGELDLDTAPLLAEKLTEAKLPAQEASWWISIGSGSSTQAACMSSLPGPA